MQYDKQKFKNVLVGASLSFPLFFTTNGSVFVGDASTYEFSLPLGFFVVLFSLIFSAPRLIQALFSAVPLLFLVGWLFTVFNAAIQIGDGDWSLFILYFAPAMVGFFATWCMNVRYEQSMKNLLIGYAYGAICAAFLHLIASFSTIGLVESFSVRGVDLIFGLFSIYQKYIYYATNLAFGFFITLVFIEGRAKWFGIIILVSDILLVGSREAALLVVCFSIFYSMWVFKSRKNYILYAVISYASALALVTVSYILLRNNVEDFVFMAKLVDVIEASDSEMLTGARDVVMREVISTFDIDSIFVLVGSGFRTDIGEIGTPHNQYVEWFLRGGVFFLIFNLMSLLAGIAVNFYKGGRVSVAAATVLFASMIICNNINTPFRAPYCSILLWLLIGYGFASKKPHIDEIKLQ